MVFGRLTAHRANPDIREQGIQQNNNQNNNSSINQQESAQANLAQAGIDSAREEIASIETESAMNFSNISETISELNEKSNSINKNIADKIEEITSFQEYIDTCINELTSAEQEVIDAASILSNTKPTIQQTIVDKNGEEQTIEYSNPEYTKAKEAYEEALNKEKEAKDALNKARAEAEDKNEELKELNNGANLTQEEIALQEETLAKAQAETNKKVEALNQKIEEAQAKIDEITKQDTINYLDSIAQDHEGKLDDYLKSEGWFDEFYDNLKDFYRSDKYSNSELQSIIQQEILSNRALEAATNGDKEAANTLLYEKFILDVNTNKNTVQDKLDCFIRYYGEDRGLEEFNKTYGGNGILKDYVINLSYDPLNAYLDTPNKDTEIILVKNDSAKSGYSFAQYYPEDRTIDVEIYDDLYLFETDKFKMDDVTIQEGYKQYKTSTPEISNEILKEKGVKKQEFETFEEIFQYSTGVEYDPRKAEEYFKVQELESDLNSKIISSVNLQNDLTETLNPMCALEVLMNDKKLSLSEAIDKFNEIYSKEFMEENFKEYSNVDLESISCSINDKGKCEFRYQQKDGYYTIISYNGGFDYDFEKEKVQYISGMDNSSSLIESEFEFTNYDYDGNELEIKPAFPNTLLTMNDINYSYQKNNVLLHETYEEFTNNKEYQEFLKDNPEYNTGETDPDKIAGEFLKYCNDKRIEAFGESEFNEAFENYMNDMDSYATKITTIVQTSSIIGSLIFPPLKFVALGAGYIDNIIDLVNMATNDPEYQDDYGQWALGTIKEMTLQYGGMKIGQFANACGDAAWVRAITNGVTKNQALAIKIGTEVLADAVGSVGFDILTTGDLNVLEHLEGENLSLMLDIISGIRFGASTRMGNPDVVVDIFSGKTVELMGDDGIKVVFEAKDGNIVMEQMKLGDDGKYKQISEFEFDESGKCTRAEINDILKTKTSYKTETELEYIEETNNPSLEKVNSVDDLSELEQKLIIKGYSPETVMAFANLGIRDFEMFGVIDFDPEVVKTYIDLGVYDFYTSQYIEKGISAQDVKNYIDLGLDSFDTKQFIEKGVSAQVVKSYLDLNIKTYNIGSFIDAKMTVEDVKLFGEYGIEPVEAVTFWRGIDPKEASEYMNLDIRCDEANYMYLRGGNTKDIKNFKSLGYSTEDSKRMVIAGSRVEDIQYFQSRGYTLKQAKAFVESGISQKTANILESKGYKLEEANKKFGIISTLNHDKVIENDIRTLKDFETFNEILYGQRYDSSLTDWSIEVGGQTINFHPSYNMVTADFTPEGSHGNDYFFYTKMDSRLKEELANTCEKMYQKGEELPSEVYFTDIRKYAGGYIRLSDTEKIIFLDMSQTNNLDTTLDSFVHETHHIGDKYCTTSGEMQSTIQKEKHGINIGPKTDITGKGFYNEDICVDYKTAKRLIGSYAISNEMEYVAEVSRLITRGAITENADGSYTMKENIFNRDGGKVNFNTETDSEALKNIMSIYYALTQGAIANTNEY